MPETLPTRRWPAALLIWVLGAWIALTIGASFVATMNFRVTDPKNLRDADSVYRDVPQGEPRRQALRYVASELNRHLFSAYNVVNTALAAAALGLFWLSGMKSRVVVAGLALCLALSLAFLVYLTPTLIELGRTIDFMPREPEPPEVSRFKALHGASMALELAKLVLLGVASAAAVRARSIAS